MNATDTDSTTRDELAELIARHERAAESRRRKYEATCQAEQELDWMFDTFIHPVEDLYVKTAARLGECVGGDLSATLPAAVRHLAIAAEAMNSALSALREERAHEIWLSGYEARREAATAPLLP